jgi:hypothetical protein
MASTPSEYKYQIFPATFLVFVDAGENLVIAYDVVTPSNPLVLLVEEEELEKPSFNMNVSQRPCDEESFQRVVCT